MGSGTHKLAGLVGVDVANAAIDIADVRIFAEELNAEQITWLANPDNVGEGVGPTLFMDGIGITNRIELLYIQGSLNLVNSYIFLMVQVDNGLCNSGSSPDDDTTLFLKNTQEELELTQSKTLYIEGGMTHSADTISLFINTDGSSKVAPLFIRAPGTVVGAIPNIGSATLFINRPNEVVVGPLFLKVFDTGANTYAPLFIESTISVNSDDDNDHGGDSPPLVIPNVVSAEVNTYTTLAISGVGLLELGPAAGSASMWLPLDDNAGYDTVVNLRGGNGGLANGEHTDGYSVEGPNGVANKALSFEIDGPFAYIFPPVISGFMTVSMWVRRTNLDAIVGASHFLDSGGSGDSNERVSFGFTDTNIGMRHGFFWMEFDTELTSDTEWHHYLWVTRPIDDDEISWHFILDNGIGAVAPSNTANEWFDAANTHTLAGPYDSVGDLSDTDAEISDVRIFPTEISAAQITWLANSDNLGKGLSPTLFIDAYGLINDSAPLFVKQETQLLNTYTGLYVPGVIGIINSDTDEPLSPPLVMPNILDVTSDSIPFYIFGW